jgi:hypothetical protein
MQTDTATITHPAWIVGGDACRLGIAPFGGRAAAARYLETTRGIAPYKTMVAVPRCAMQTGETPVQLEFQNTLKTRKMK